MDSRGLRQRVAISAQTTGQDSSGQRVQAWTPVVTLWADVLAPGGMETIKGDKPVSLVRASIKVRKHPGIAAGMRAETEGQVYAIQSILPDVRDRGFVHLVCEAAK